jgi:hypothetical protein
MAVQVAEIVHGCLRRRVALAEVDGRVGVVRTRLLDASCCRRIGAFIHSGLHLLQELVDVHQVILGPQVGQRQGILMLRHVTVVTTSTAMSMAINRNERRASRHVVC